MKTRSRTTRRNFHSLPGVAGVLVGLGLMASALQAQVQTYTCPSGFGPLLAPAVPATLLSSLKTVPNPVIPTNPATGAPMIREDLVDYIAFLPKAIELGKALFWDMQAGSDDKTACASCHFQAGADVRWKNQLEPGPNKNWSPKAANAILGATDFPFTDPAVPKDTDNIAGSQGVRKSTFVSINTKTGAESTTLASDSVFNVNGVNVRQVTGKNSPSAINSVFNHRQFHNGRAQPEFNGVNPFGYRDPSARVRTPDSKGNLLSIDIKISNASLASQAVGPPLNTTEMSATNRTFPDLGRKLLLRTPLGLQKVDPTDSVLGPLAAPGTAKGLTTTYKTLIQQAFQPKWWNSSKSVSINGKSYSMMEANFSLYWGLAIMLYEATLVADNSPMDQYLASRVFTLNPDGTIASYTSNPNFLQPVVTRLNTEFNTTLTTEDILNGLALFELPVAPPPSYPIPTAAGVPQAGAGCIACHLGAETTSASIRNVAGGGLEAGDAAFKNAGFDLRMERMFKKMDWTPPGPLTPVPAGTDSITFDPNTYAINVVDINGSPVTPLPLPVVTYDSGWYNLGVRPSTDDLGVGALDPFGKPLSWTEYFQQTLANPSVIKVPGGGLASACVPPSAALGTPFAGEVLNPLTGFPLLAGGLLKTEPTDVAGTFKTLALRNVELNGPYFHNGGKSTLAQVVDLYDGGGDFANPTKSPLMVPLMLSQQQITDLVAFLLALTDERVMYQRAPFDHPELPVPNGAPDASPGTDDMVTIPAVGTAGGGALSRFLGLNPFSP